jgi:hypothetical protein
MSSRLTGSVAASFVISVMYMTFDKPVDAQPADVPEIRPGVLAGYLSPEALPNSLALLPPPPATGSAALALDEEISRKVANCAIRHAGHSPLRTQTLCFQVRQALFPVH